jgi:site-specific DNA-methyltransferase (adenine-specific)
MRAEGYNGSYPITLEADRRTLVDGGHRIAAARLAGVGEVPYLLKPDGVSSIYHTVRCNRDGATTDEHDVFDLAELCWHLAEEEGWTGQQIADELRWGDKATVTRHVNIKKKLCPSAWILTRNPDLATDDEDGVVNRKLTIVNWQESHFRTFLKHLSWSDGDDIAAKNQVEVVEACQKRYKDKDKITAQWIGDIACRYGWYTELEKYVLENLSGEVPEEDKTGLIESIYANAFGKKLDERNKGKLVAAVAVLNEKALGIKLYHGDAFEVVPQLEDGSVPLVTTDPPYNVTEEEWDKIGTDEEYLDFTRRWLAAVRPKLAKDYHLFFLCAKKYRADIEILLREEGWPILSRLTWWHKNMSKGRDVTEKFISASDEIFHCGTHPLNWHPDWDEKRQDVLEFAVPQSNFKEGKHHPTAKPVELFELFVKIGSKPGDLVLDLFAGGGTTGQACTNVGQRRCILIEEEGEFCKDTENRLGIKRQKISGDGGD